MPGLPKMLQGNHSRDSFSSQGQMLSSRLGGGADLQEVRELKLRLAKKENELREVNKTLAELKLGKQHRNHENDELARERDALVI